MPPITLASLKVLSVATVDCLLFFKTPALEELVISERDHFLTSISIKTIVSRFFSSLHRLRRLVLLGFDPEDAEQVFQYLPIVQDIYFIGKGDISLRALSNCPNTRYLEAVTFEMWVPLNYGDTLLELILSCRSHASGGIGPFKNLERLSL